MRKVVEANQESSDKDPHLKYRRDAKGWAIAGAVIYSLFALFFTYAYIAFSCMLFDRPASTSKMILTLLIYYSFLLPVPLPVYLMLRNYLKKEKKPTFPSLSVLVFYYGAIVFFMVKLVGIESRS